MIPDPPIAVKSSAASTSERAACPLCGSDRVRDFARDGKRSFLRCAVCSLVFVPSAQRLAPADEKERYDLHRNAPGDDGYRRFLGRMVASMQPRLAPGSRGLDFGSGPVPVLARMFEAAGHTMTIYDPFYEPDSAALEGQYDFITATEVVEHLRDPKRELHRLWGCLRPGGRLGIMTRPAADRDAFGRWHYKNDLTHICFFSPRTFAWLAGQWKAELAFPEEDIAIFHKENGPA